MAHVAVLCPELAPALPQLPVRMVASAEETRSTFIRASEQHTEDPQAGFGKHRAGNAAVVKIAGVKAQELRVTITPGFV